MFRLSTYTILGIVFLSSSLFTFVSSDQCIHDHIMESMATHVPHERRQLSTTSKQFYNFTVNEHGRALQSTFSPIRIKLDVSRLYDGGYVMHTKTYGIFSPLSRNWKSNGGRISVSKILQLPPIS